MYGIDVLPEFGMVLKHVLFSCSTALNDSRRASWTTCVVFFLKCLTYLFVCATELPSTTSVIKPKYFLTACAMIQNEMNVLFEWIEFHRIQGVDHFVFLDDESTDDIYLLPRLYAGLGYPDLVEVLPQNFRRHQKPTSHSYGDYNDGQMQGLNHCNTRLAGTTEWLLVSDVDEFMFSHNYHTIANFIHNQTNSNISQISVEVIRFGTNGIQNENRATLSLNPYTDQITLLTEVYNGHILLTSRNSNRAPFPKLDTDYEQRYNATCARTTNPSDCQHAIGKCIWRPDKCALAGVHWCEKGLIGETIHPPVEDLRINHYAFRSKEHVENQPKHQMGSTKNRVYNSFDAVWFSSLEDNSTKRYHAELVSRLDSIPSVTVFHTRIGNSEWTWSFLANETRLADYIAEYASLIACSACFVSATVIMLWRFRIKQCRTAD